MADNSFEKQIIESLAKKITDNEIKEFEMIKPYCESIFKSIIDIINDDGFDQDSYNGTLVVNIVDESLKDHLWLKNLHTIHNEHYKDEHMLSSLPLYLPTVFVPIYKSVNIFYYISKYLESYYGVKLCNNCSGKVGYFTYVAQNVNYIAEGFLRKCLSMPKFKDKKEWAEDIIWDSVGQYGMYELHDVEWALKEAIKNYWGKKLNDGNKSTVLFIDSTGYIEKAKETEYYKNNSPGYHFNKLMEECK